MAHDRSAAPKAPGLVPVGRESVTREVASRLFDYLGGGHVAPGARIPSERQLAEALQVGRSAIRETLAALEVLGIVDSRPGSGTYLREHASDLLPSVINWGLALGQPRTLDLVEARAELELITARLAAARASSDDIERLSQHVTAMSENRDSLSDFIEADVAFHLEIADIAKNTVLADMLHSVRSLLQVWVQRAVTADGTESTMQEHVAVYEAIAAFDPDQAAEAMRNHMRSASDRLRRSLQVEQDQSPETDPARTTR